ncbi:membrane-bound O-acyltransferase family protein, partial [Pseudomonas citronellolis]|nr:membrane-bound O-acyltransferase family protein [Pseudomonas citronellolis]
GSTFQTYRNLILTMLLGGLWHGANVTYVIWGAWHGVWLAIERALGVNAAPRALNPLKWAFTFGLVIVGWVIFRAENLHVAWRMYAAMFSFGDWSLSEQSRASLTGLQVGTLVVAYAAILAGACWRLRQAGTPALLPALAGRTVLLALFAASVLKLSAQSYSPFLYFQF